MEGNLRFKIDWASLLVGSKITVCVFFTLYLRAICYVRLRYLKFFFRGKGGS